MLWGLREWNRRRVLRRVDTSATGWQSVWSELPVLQRLDDDEARRLRELAALFLEEKSFEPVQGLELDARMRRIIALEACLPILNLGFDWLDPLISVVVYPDVFVSEVTEHDESGVVHQYREERAGECWDHGPLLLSWADVAADGDLDGYNVVLHEIAHRLDAVDGGSNGRPPLHAGMNEGMWTTVFTRVFEDLARRVDRGEETVVDAYAAESPAECFAVFTEAFFEIPQVIADAYPEVYAQLAMFYRQDPGNRTTPGVGA